MFGYFSTIFILTISSSSRIRLLRKVLITPTVVLISALLFSSCWVSSPFFFRNSVKELSFNSFQMFSPNLLLLEKQRTQRRVGSGGLTPHIFNHNARNEPVCAVLIAIRLRVESFGVRIPGEEDIFLFSKTTRQALGTTQPATRYNS